METRKKETVSKLKSFRRGPGRQFGDLVRFMKIDLRREAIR